MKVTYLFGAGASKEALPIVNEIPSRIKEIIELLESEEYKLSDEAIYEDLNLELSKRQVQVTLINDLKWLLEKANNHASIDTFAKKLYLRDKPEDLKRLKISFSIFLIIEQTRNKADKRYDSFFASILTDHCYNFPTNIRIVSWNYDYQFEKVYNEYSNQDSFKRNQYFLNVISKNSFAKPENNKFAIIKLNGSAAYFKESDEEIYFSNQFHLNISIEFIEEILKTYAQVNFSQTKYYLGLSFAWERNMLDERDIVTFAKNETNDTDILIVIGYSFPYFNREIDREIIGNMINLKRVYFQDPYADNIKERFLSIRPNFKSENLISRFDVGQFLLPNEL